MALTRDIVLLKPALNSGDPYPSTTHPLALEVTSRLLADRVATVVIGDQSGIGHVLHHPGGVIRGIPGIIIFIQGWHKKCHPVCKF
jgi:hypothetical protein